MAEFLEDTQKILNLHLNGPKSLPGEGDVTTHLVGIHVQHLQGCIDDLFPRSLRAADVGQPCDDGGLQGFSGNVRRWTDLLAAQMNLLRADVVEVFTRAPVSALRRHHRPAAAANQSSEQVMVPATDAVEIVDADVSTVTAATDRVPLVRSDEGDRIQHFDFQSGPDATVPRRSHSYNALLEERHESPVDSVVVLLHPKANLRTIHGVYERPLPGETEPYLRFRYRVIRVWELPVETILAAGLSVLPLAPLNNVGRERLPKVIERMEERFATLAETAKIGELGTATKVLMGLRYDEAFTERLLQGVRAMKDSVTYQAIVAEGRLAEARRILLRVGEEQFRSAPSEDQQTVIDSIPDSTRLEDLILQAMHVKPWSDLLAAPSPPAPRRRKKS